MYITVSENLKELRRKKGCTQDALAAYLNVSGQAVSKWERGESQPELEYIVKLAAFYNVTVDDLLGVGEIRKQEKFAEYKAESLALQKVGKISETVDLWQEALKEFPDDLFVMSCLAFALCFDNSRGSEKFKEAIKLDEQILRKSTDQYQRSISIERLCKSYNAIGEKQKAIEYADMAKSMFHSSELMRLDVLEGEEKELHAKWLVHELTIYICNIVENMDNIDLLKRCEFIISLLELVYDDFLGFAAGVACNAHYLCSRIYADCENEEKARYHLEKLTEYAGQADGLKDKFTYRSAILDGLEGDAATLITNSEKSYSENYLTALTDSDSRMFDRWRETDWFKSLVKSLKEQSAK